MRIILLILFLAPQIVCAEYKYNWSTGEFESASKSSRMNYNVMEQKWNYSEPNSVYKYNYMDNRYEQVPSHYQLKNNYMENKWGYEKPNSRLKYNPMKSEWEYEK
jgi:hypothetical protein